MTTEVQARTELGTKPIGGILVPIVLAGIGSIAAVALLLSYLWVVGAIGVAALGFLLFRSPRLYVYLYLVIALLPISFLQYLDQFRLLGGAEETVNLVGSSANLVGLGWVLNVVLFGIYTYWKRENWWRIRFYRPFLVLIAISLPTIFFTTNPMLGLRNWIHLVSAICLSLLLFSTITNRAQAMQAIRHIFLIFSVVLAIGFFQLLTGAGSYDVAADTYRLSGIYGEGEEVDSASLLLYLACLATPMVLERKLKSSALTIVICASSVILLLASQSRAPLLAFLAAALVLISKSKAKLKYALVFLLAVLAAQFSPRVYSRFGGPLLAAPSNFWKDQDISVNATQRMATWVMLSQELVDLRTLVVGRGLGFVDNYLLNVLEDPANLFARVVHNDYLRFLLDLGLTGVILFIGQLILLYRVGSKLFHEARDSLARSLAISLCALVTGFAIVAATINMYTTAQYAVFWILTGLLLATTKWAPLGEPAARVGAGANAI